MITSAFVIGPNIFAGGPNFPTIALNHNFADLDLKNRKGACREVKIALFEISTEPQVLYWHQ